MHLNWPGCQAVSLPYDFFYEAGPQAVSGGFYRPSSSSLVYNGYTGTPQQLFPSMRLCYFGLKCFESWREDDRKPSLAMCFDGGEFVMHEFEVLHVLRGHAYQFFQ